MHVQQRQPQQATSRPFNLRLANIVGVLLIVLGSVGILFNFIDLGAGTSTDEVRHIDSHYTNKQGSGDRWLSELSLGVAVHGVWCGILVSGIDMPYLIALSSLRPSIALNPKSIAFISVIFVLIVLFDCII